MNKINSAAPSSLLGSNLSKPGTPNGNGIDGKAQIPKEFRRQSVKNPNENTNFLSVSNINKDTSKGDDSGGNGPTKEFKSTKIMKDAKKNSSFKAKQLNLQSQRISNMKEITENKARDAEEDELANIISQSIKGHTNQ